MKWLGYTEFTAVPNPEYRQKSLECVCAFCLSTISFKSNLHPTHEFTSSWSLIYTLNSLKILIFQGD